MILFSDDINFKEKNFPALYQFLINKNITYVYDKTFKPNSDFIWNEMETVDFNSIDRDFSYQNILLYAIYKYELLQKCMQSDVWVEHCPILPSEDDLWYLFDEYFKDELVNCIKQSIFWLNYWMQNDNIKKCNVGLFFSGGQIYNRAFCEILKLRGKLAIGMEHYFTGNDFYFEPRYEPIPNNSIIKNKTYFDKVLHEARKETTIELVDKKMSQMSNKNVTQPSYESIKLSNYVLILMQVRSDYAIASESNPYKNPVKFYIDLIKNILEYTDKNIVVKAHPYERNKLKDGDTPSITFIESFIDSLEKKYKDRVFIYEDHSVYGLIDSAGHVVTLNSQSGIEAAERGKATVVFGLPFYANKGFTVEFDVVSDYINKFDSISLDLKNMKSYQNFKMAIFKHLIGVNEADKISRILGEIGGGQPAPQPKAQPAPQPKAQPAPQPKAQPAPQPKVNEDKIVRLVNKFRRDPVLFIKDTRIVKKILGD